MTVISPLISVITSYSIHYTKLYEPVFLKERGESLWFAGISLSILQGAGVAGTFLAGSLSDKIGRRKMLIIASLGAPISFFLFLLTSGFLQMIILILVGLFLFATAPVFLAIVNEHKTEHSNFVNAVFMTTTFLIGAIMVMLVGLLGDYLSLETTYIIAGCGAFLSIPFAFKIPN